MQYKLVFSLSVLLLLGICDVQAENYYVDREHSLANDNNPGSEELPWKTLVYAAKVAGAGDTVWVKAGIYTDGDVVVGHSGAPGQELVFAAYPGDEHKAVIKGAESRFARSRRIHSLSIRYRMTTICKPTHRLSMQDCSLMLQNSILAVTYVSRGVGRI
ncbi:MAG: hypothetical protein PVG22_12700 [Chromatiales bacterium]